MNRYVRALFSLGTLALIVLYGLSVRPAPQVWGLLVVLCVLYQAMIWMRESWWTPARYAIAVGLAIAITVAVSLSDGERMSDSALLIPPILLLAREQGTLKRVAILLAAAAVAAMLALSRLSSFTFAVVPGVLAMYASIRAINIYKEAHRTSQMHLAALDATHRELQQAHAELQEASALSMRHAALMERARLAREMHDGLGHLLTSLIVQLQGLEIMVAQEPERVAGEIRSLLDVARQAMAEVRQAVSEWREDERGLGLVALQGLVSQTAARSHLTIEFQQDGDISDWPVEVSVALYRIVQEALTNIMRHADASSVCVRVTEHDRLVTLCVADDGRFTAEAPLTPGFGLKGIMERSQALGGSCTLSQNLPHGLMLRVVLPVEGQSREVLPAPPLPFNRRASSLNRV